MDPSNSSNAADSITQASSSNGRTFVIRLIFVILVFMVLVVLRCMLEYHRQKRSLHKKQLEVLERRKFKKELETAVKYRRERLEQQENLNGISSASSSGAGPLALRGPLLPQRSRLEEDLDAIHEVPDDFVGNNIV